MTDYMARKSKEIVQDKGVLSTPNPKAGHSLSAETVKLVTDFIEDISQTLFCVCETASCTVKKLVLQPSLSCF